MVVVFVVVVVD